ncbi:MAG: hypothetical protein P4N60_19170 [Verrucomicrobiae bacterium]|nr:hypothetical protein [Verrucomicrobiae bacterium]
MKAIRRTIHPEVKVIDAAKGIVEYIASNETLDYHNEIVRADGWQFNRFKKNAPFVDSHNYECLDCLLGKVIDWKLSGNNLVETVQWAIDAGLPEDHLANIGFKMTAAGYLKAVSVGFQPIEYCTRWDNDKTVYNEQCAALGLSREVSPDVIYIQHEQLELSACIIGANADAVARAYKAGVVTDAFLEKISTEVARLKTADSTDGPAAVEKARQRVRMATLMEFKTKINRL